MVSNDCGVVEFLKSVAYWSFSGLWLILLSQACCLLWFQTPVAYSAFTSVWLTMVSKACVPVQALCFERASRFALAMVLPVDAWIQVLFLISDPAIMRLLRASSATVNGAGELARATVEARVVRLNGRPCLWPDLFRRMLWWTPFVRELRVYSPPRDAPPAARARFDQLYGLNVFSQRGRDGDRVYVVMYGCSSQTIFWSVYLNGTGWAPRAVIWHTEMDERRMQQQQ